MTKNAKSEIVSFRCSRSRRELKAKFGNVSRKLNELVEREFANSPRKRHWSEILDRPRPVVPDKVWKRILALPAE